MAKASLVKVDCRIYPLDVVLSAAYMFTNEHYVMIDGDPKKELTVRIEPKKGAAQNIEKEFSNELVNYANYAVRVLKNQILREAIIARVLKTHDLVQQSDALPEPAEPQAEEYFIDDPEGIAIPWEEKYGKLQEKTPPDESIDDPEGIAIPWEEKYGKDANKS